MLKYAGNLSLVMFYDLKRSTPTPGLSCKNLHSFHQAGRGRIFVIFVGFSEGEAHGSFNDHVKIRICRIVS